MTGGTVRTSALPPMLRQYLAWTLALLALSTLYSALMTPRFHTPLPYGLNILDPVHWGWDFLSFQARFLHFRQPNFWDDAFFPLTYPAPVGVLFALLYRLADPLRVYLFFFGVSLGLWAGWLASELRARGVYLAIALGFSIAIAATALPVWFELASANIEAIVTVTLALGVLAVLRQRWWLGAALIGIAGAMKIYPFVLLALLLSRRRYKQAAWGVVVAAIVTLASLVILGPTPQIARHQLDNGYLFLRDAYIFSLRGDDCVFNHSLFVPVKLLAARLHFGPRPDYIAAIVRQGYAARNDLFLLKPYDYYLALVATFGIAAYFLRIRTLPLLNQVLALTVCAVLLPPISLTYTLLNLFLPFGLLCLYAARNRWQQMPSLEKPSFWRSQNLRSEGLGAGADRRQTNSIAPASLRCFFACFLILFTPGTFFTIRHRFGGLAQTLALILLLFLSMRYPLPWTELDARPGDHA